MQCKLMQCVLTSNRNGKAVAAAHGQTRAKVAMAAKASPRREARARTKMRNRPASFKVNAGIARRRDTRKRSAAR